MPKVDNPTSPLVPRLSGLHLFHFDGAPCAQRVRFALAEKGLVRGREVRFDADDDNACRGTDGAWVSRIVSLVKKDHLTPAYAQIQPNLVVPALVHDGTLIIESMDIIEYLDTVFGGEPLIPRHDAARLADAEALTQQGKALHQAVRFVSFRWGLGRLARLNAQEEAKLKQLVAAGNDDERLAEFYRGYSADTFPQHVYREHLAALIAAFTTLDTRLADGRPFLTGDSLTMADVLWAMKVLRLTECGYPFRACHPRIAAWYARIAARPSFQSGVLGKHRALHRAFRLKARLDDLTGTGLRSLVPQTIAARDAAA